MPAASMPCSVTTLCPHPLMLPDIGDPEGDHLCSGYLSAQEGHRDPRTNQQAQTTTQIILVLSMFRCFKV